MQKNNRFADLFTQEELTKYFNISKPPVCDVHHQCAKIYYDCNDDKFKLDVCCESLVTGVRMHIAQQMSKTSQE